jgi:hypothetical protein
MPGSISEGFRLMQLKKGEIILNPGPNYIKHFWRYLRDSQNLMVRANIVIKKDKMFNGIGLML